MISINEYLDEILEDFREYAESGEELCKLKGVHFDFRKIPDYSDINVQQLYLLRYAYAYAFEYKCMYLKLRKMLPDTSHISVTSVGCGAMIDCWSLRRAFPDSQIKYIGVDKINWHYKKHFYSCADDVGFLECDLADYITGDVAELTDVYIFPKSISELSDEALERMCLVIGDLAVYGETVYFLVSLRADPYNLDDDMDKTRKMYHNMIRVGFTSHDDPETSPHMEPDDKIRNLDSDFNHPSDVVDYLTCILPGLCTRVDTCSDSGDCVERLRRFPTLSSSLIRYQIFKFMKEA